MQGKEKKNTGISERILEMISIQGDNKNNFAAKLGYSRSQTVYDIVNEKSAPSFDFFNRFSNSEYSEKFNTDWLLTGNGNKFKEVQKNTLPDLITQKLIPLYDTTSTAGIHSTADLTPLVEPVEMIDAGDWFRDATAAMRVHGDSMHPDYASGSIVAMKEVNNKRLVIPGQDYIIETTEYRVIKRLQKSKEKQYWLACSTNQEIWEVGPLKGNLIHEPFDIHIDDITRLYIVLGSVKRNHSSNIIFNNN